ncbi:haloacid dehalogenase type II [Pantoea sp. PNT01]|jgi:2-haloacid dehalogenase|uniref:haloacid dehalogenase type II n=1 Tax=Pantoea TaxID=53335 RepID=UPI0001E0F01D|nr:MULTISPECIES: haloacid dehalogenase type II [Pantoea]QXG56578.1 haloacid dehalogenase type II [Pantoea jilinensis]AWP35345.1 haloacid dehalogenase type II [Pantoea vagans]EFM18112.1 haloacid dehalogenase, type II [Pantoea sp. aB]MBD9554392.1 haloacid dehalogenase type II [Pantoea sp. PNT01]QNQ61209.1 haloacid dehalogenase type II [Pantoea sp. MT58]
MTDSHNPAPYSGTLFFDVNETLLDTTELNRVVAQRLGDRPERAEAWFTSLLHHSLVESVTGSWHNFGDIAEAVLQMTATRYGITLPADATPLADIIAAMPAHPDVAAGLSALQQQGFTLVALTNSSAALAEKQLSSAGLARLFTRILSVEQVQVYKPDLKVYQWAMQEMDQPASQCMMVAAHGWDVGGAKRAGMKTAFVTRKGQALYPLAPAPDLIVSDIGALATKLKPLC